jgi:DNA mismatch endonuclease (patch repair protein)
MDVLTREQRQLNMSRIRGRDTRPELMLRKALHAQGLRYRLHARSLPGRPDLILPRYRAAILVHGCFWHGHDCPLFRMPATRHDFWSTKIRKNQERDQRVIAALRCAGWRVLTVWECCLKGPGRLTLPHVVRDSIAFIRSVSQCAELRGFPDARSPESRAKQRSRLVGR